MKTGIEWHFGGWLESLPPALAWGILGGLGLAGLGMIAFSYRHTLRDLPLAARGMLTAMRVALLLAILLCLANPQRVERRPADETPRTLAVLVDRSASMNAADNRNETPLGNVLKTWKPHADVAGRSFEKLAYYRFGTGLDKAASLETAATAATPDAETHLYSALEKALDDAPAAIVCLTDGLDTSAAEPAGLIARAQRQGVPLFFVPAQNRGRREGFVTIREVKTPSRVLRQSQFPASIAVEVAAAKDGQLPIEVWSGPRKLAATSLAVRAGSNVLPWSTTLQADEPGLMPLEFRVGGPADPEISASTTRVIPKATVDVLYYQGALLWGYRFFLSALRDDPSFQVSSILNPGLGIRMTAGADDGPAPMLELPDRAEDLEPFQIVVLANVFADQLSAAQQQALVDYAKRGGGILFITPDAESSRQFAGTSIEKLLPIVFEAPLDESSPSVADLQFQERMAAAGGADSQEESDFAAAVRQRQEIRPLKPFAPPADAPATTPFRPGPEAPQFCEYVPVQAAKPGAQVLAIHPNDRAADGMPRILFAHQRYGAGFVAALTTDLLWRWKLSLPSESRAAETFWQQLMLSLAPPFSGNGLRVFRVGDPPSVAKPVTIRVEGPASDPPRGFASDPAGARLPLDFREVPGAEPAAWEARFAPDRPGRWEVTAETEAGDMARMTLAVTVETRNAETANLPPDLPAMRGMAEATGGSVIGREPVAFPPPQTSDRSGPLAHARPLWNSPWIIAVLLGLYGLELLIRRGFRLL
jgi:hypothetical protein